MPTRKKSTKSKSTTVVSASQKSSPFSNLKLKDLIIPAIIVIAVLLLGTFKHLFVVASVNGQQISRLSLIAELERKDGRAVLENMVTENLILQEAKKKKINIGQDEVNSEITKIEKSVTDQGQNLDMLLAQQNMSRDDLKRQVEIQLILRKMVGEQKATDKEVDDYIEKNKESMPEGTDPATAKAQIKQQLEQQKLSEKIQAFVADLQKNAKINYFIQ